MKVFVVGCGGWGMALSILLHENGHTVTSWTCFEEECKLLREQRGNEKLLPGIKLPEEIEITTDLNGAAAADLVGEIYTRNRSFINACCTSVAASLDADAARIHVRIPRDTSSAWVGPVNATTGFFPLVARVMVSEKRQ